MFYSGQKSKISFKKYINKFHIDVVFAIVYQIEVLRNSLQLNLPLLLFILTIAQQIDTSTNGRAYDDAILDTRKREFLKSYINSKRISVDIVCMSTSDQGNVRFGSYFREH